MLTATGLIESWDQTPTGPTADGRETLPIDLSGPHWDTPPLPEWIDPALRPPAPYSPIDGTRVAPLDGMRAFAVTAVILYHANPSWAVGGYFGVDVFFVLSGFLITTLLLGEWRGSGGVGLRAFWGRRARRLLPALFVMLAVVGTVSVLLPRVLGSPGLLGDTLATVGYVANWHFISIHANYFATVANPSPLQHTWTLAIEEQFYLIWPLILLVLVGGFRRLRRPSGPSGRRRLALVAGMALAGAAASALAMALLTPVGAVSVNRSYYGSDTRAQGLLIGAALAAGCLWWGPVRTATGRRLLGVAGLVGSVGVLVMWRLVPESSALTFHGGFALLALATAGVIACVTLLSRHPVAGFLSLPPLPYLGKISYGMYLWYWPVLLVMTAQRTHLSGVALLAARLAVIVAIAALSFHLVESPIHRGRLAGWRSLVVVPLAALAVSLLPLLMPSASAVVPSASTASLPFTGAGASVGVGGVSGAGAGGAAGVVGVVGAAGTVGASATRPVRVLLVGDSMAGSLGVGLTAVASRYGAEILNEGSPGCSLAEADQVRVLWFVNPPGTPCQAGNPSGVIDTYRSLVRQFDPDVVVYLARSDTLDTQLDGSWQHLGEATFDFWAEARYDQAITALSSGGAHVVLLTSPYYNSGEEPDGSSWPENDPARVITDNSLLMASARQDPGKASVFNLGALLSPGNQFDTSVGGVTARCSDGVHMTVPGGELVAAKLLPRLVALGHSHTQLQSTASRPAIPVVSQPWWYSDLPCGT
jgi:peptidoglycan/LPS O-acetylase OafA/YrhL